MHPVPPQHSEAQTHSQYPQARRKGNRNLCRKDRYRGTVVQIGEAPKLRIESGEEFHFAYRSVKKRPGEQRQILVVGDIVDCRLTKTDPVKAVSIKIVSKMPASPEPAVPTPATPTVDPPPETVYQHDPYEAQLSLFKALGGQHGITASVDSLLSEIDVPNDVVLLGAMATKYHKAPSEVPPQPGIPQPDAAVVREVLQTEGYLSTGHAARADVLVAEMQGTVHDELLEDVTIEPKRRVLSAPAPRRRRGIHIAA
eukprot:Sspe_Gene.21338::Locus_7992_Transcript_2_2_Confidence_0.500_Length_943::g.21338::m.21338